MNGMGAVLQLLVVANLLKPSSFIEEAFFLVKNGGMFSTQNAKLCSGYLALKERNAKNSPRAKSIMKWSSGLSVVHEQEILTTEEFVAAKKSFLGL